MERYIDPTGKSKYLTEEVIELNKERDRVLKASIENKKDFNKILDDRVGQGSLTEKSAELISQIHRLRLMHDEREANSNRPPQKRFEINVKPRWKKAEGGDIDAQMGALMESGETHTMPDGTEMPGATHEEYEETMLPDEEMESDYLDFILDEALDEEEENFLMEQLESNDRLSLIFDKVIDVATEFAGSGPVNGPGSGVSDSIPARLSDGEFVFTAKATEELGEDTLMSLMKEAEAASDERQNVAYGGMIDEEDQAIPLPTQGSRAALGNVPNVVKQSRQVEEEMLKSSPRRYYVPVSG